MVPDNNVVAGVPPQATLAYTFPLDVDVAADTDLPADVLRLVDLVPKADSCWVLRDFGYEDERSIIAELRPRTIDYVLVINSGGC